MAAAGRGTLQGEIGTKLRVNRTILEDLEAKVLALRALHAKLRDAEEGPSFGEIVAPSRPLTSQPAFR